MNHTLSRKKFSYQTEHVGAYQVQREIAYNIEKCFVGPNMYIYIYKTKTKLRGLSSRANYTDRAAAGGRRSYC
jgi:hypothetical protein